MRQFHYASNEIYEKGEPNTNLKYKHIFAAQTRTWLFIYIFDEIN